MKTILVTGGAGFIGSHLVDELIRKGHRVRILDNLDPQVHGADRSVPSYLNRDAEFQRGDIRDETAVERALSGVQVVFHEAAAVGVAQSMYEIDRYVHTNSGGTATLLQAILRYKPPIEKLIVASSMSIYGEGEYECAQHGAASVNERDPVLLEKKRWEPECPTCRSALRAVPTRESKLLYPTSIYALTKKDQEEMSLIFGRNYGIPAVALRYFNVYGIRQALSNPYTGVIAIFSARYLNGKAPIVFEDGGQLRDFVHVSDVVRANVMAMESSAADGRAINVGAGNSVSVLQIAQELRQQLDKSIEPEIQHTYRKGDVRHCFGNSSLAEKLLGFHAQIDFRKGMADTIEWIRQQSAEDHIPQSYEKLKDYKLIT